MKKFTLLRAFILLTGLLLAISGWGQIISQYVETNSGSTPKGIEIWNNTGVALDFSTNNLIIQQGTNGAVLADLSGTLVNSGSLAPGDVLVIGTSDMGNYLTDQGLTSVTFVSFGFTFNGDDALAVKYGGMITDIFGTPGIDPGSSWNGNGVSTANQNIQLKSGIISGDLIGWSDPSLRFETVSTNPVGTGGLEGFGIAPLAAEDPVITVNPIELSGFEYVLGSGPSDEQTFTVSGENLIDNIVLTTPTNYEVSETSGSGFTNSITLTQSGGVFTETTIYVRLKAGLATGEYNAEDITASSTGATDKTVTLSGAVIEIATTTIPYEETFDTDLGDCYTYSVSGNTKVWIWNSGGTAEMNGYNSGDVEEDWMILPGINLNDYENEVLTFETWYRYGIDDIDNYFILLYSTDYAGIGDPTSATWVELAFTKPSSDQTWTSSGNVDISAITGTSVWLAFKYRYIPVDYRWWQVDNINIFEATTPILTADPATLTGFTYVEGFGPSASQNFSASGLSLDPADGTITVTGSTNYEVSDDDITFGGSVLLPYTGGELAATNVYVRLKSGLAEGIYDSENIAITGGGATQVDVTVSGEVTSPPPGLPYAEDFSGFISVETIPDGWTVSNETYLGDWGSGTGGGLRGNANVLGFQHTSSTGIFIATLTLINSTGETIEELFISYMGMVERAAEGRSPEWTVELNDVVIPELFYSTVDGVDKNVSALIQGLSISNNEIFTIKWSSDRGLPSGSSKQIGIGEVSVSMTESYVLIGAADDASNYATWIDGSNEGYGFGPWALSSGTDGGFAGFFLGNPADAGITGMANPSFALFANPAGSNFANADRQFISPLGIGSTLSLNWGVNWDSDGAGNKGLNFYVGGTTGTEIININMGGNSSITINGDPMFNNYGTQVMTLNFEYVSEGQLRVYGTGRDGSETYDQTLSVAGSPDAVRFYASGLAPGDQRQPYFNNLLITTDPSAIPADATLFVKGQVVLENNLEIENLIIEADQFLQINPGVNLTVNGTLNNDNAGSKSEAGLLIKSDATGTGSLIHSTADVPATVERYFAGTEQWRLISSPVANQVIADVNNWTPAGTYSDGTGYDFYAYDEENSLWLNQKEGANNITNFVPGTGYLVSFQATDQTKQFEDNLNTGDVMVAITNDGTGDYAGANLIGNPYASGIDWNLATRSLFQDDFAYLYDPTAGAGAGAYVTVDGIQPDAFIAPHQGFVVLANASGNLTFDNSLKVHGGTFAKNTEENNNLMLKLSNATYYDVASFRTHENADFTRERSDAIKMFSFNQAAPQFYSFTSDQKKVAINSIPSIPEEGSIALGLQIPESGEYTISLSEISGDFENEDVYLEDLLAEITYNLKESPEYSFQADKGEINNRFLLKFGALSIPEIDGNSMLHAYTYGSILYVLSQAENAAVEVLNIQGQVIMSHQIGKGLQSLPVKVAPGAYIVRLISEGETATRKVVIQ